MKKIISISLSLITVFCLQAQQNIQLYSIPTISYFILHPQNVGAERVAIVQKNIHDPYFSVGIGANIRFQKENYFYGGSLERIVLGNAIPKEEFIVSGGTTSPITHYESRFNLTNWSLKLEGGYYFWNKTRFKLGGSIGIGLSYISNTASITTFYKSDGSQEENQEDIGTAIRKENIVASVGLPFQWQINPKFGFLLSPHFQLLLLNSTPEAELQYQYYNYGVNVGVYTIF